MQNGRREKLRQLIEELLQGGEARREAAAALLSKYFIASFDDIRKPFGLITRIAAVKYAEAIQETIELILVRRLREPREVEQHLLAAYRDKCGEETIFSSIKQNKGIGEAAVEALLEKLDDLPSRLCKKHNLTQEEWTLVWERSLACLETVILRNHYPEQASLGDYTSRLLRERVHDYLHIRLLKRGKEDRALNRLFESLSSLAKEKRKAFSLLDEEEIQTAFNQAFVEFRKFLLSDDYRGVASLRTIFEKRFELRCIDEVRKKQRMIDEPAESTTEEGESTANGGRSQRRIIHLTREDILADPGTPFEISLAEKEEFDENYRFLKAVMLSSMAKLDELCRKVLRAAAGGMTNKELAEHFKLKNANNAGSKKYNCSKKLREIAARAGGELRGDNQSVIDFLTFVYHHDF